MAPNVPADADATFHHPGGLIVHSSMGKALFGATMSKLCNDNRGGAVSHGFRASFRPWTAEAGVARDVAEICLGHTARGVEGPTSAPTAGASTGGHATLGRLHRAAAIAGTAAGCAPHHG